MKDMGEVFEAMDRLNNELKGFKQDMDQRNNRRGTVAIAEDHNWTDQQAQLRDPHAPDDADESTDMAAARLSK